MCGEQEPPPRACRQIRGSSPRVRGTAKRNPQANQYQRFIPACAGNSIVASVFVNATAVHPRVCGEQPTGFSPRNARSGSSPRVRGTGGRFTQNPLVERFIPACAGNSLFSVPARVGKTVHPRVCGEQLAKLTRRQTDAGSSPRVRGTGEPDVPFHVAQRFIPACAGNRIGAVPATRPRPVHPRVCGEQVSANSYSDRKPGSSPRVRGTEVGRFEIVARERFIPACAGNSGNMCLESPQWTVHPRVCGEQ